MLKVFFFLHLGCRCCYTSVLSPVYVIMERPEGAVCSERPVWHQDILLNIWKQPKYHLKFNFWLWYTKNECWDEINLGAYSSWHVWSTRRLRSSSNPWSLVILQVTWSVEKQLTWVSLLLETFEWKSNKDTNQPHAGREYIWRETWQIAILHTPGWQKIIRRNTGWESVPTHPNLEPNEPAAAPVVHEDVCVVRVLVDWTTPANSDLLVQSFEWNRSQNIRHTYVDHDLWHLDDIRITTHFMRRADIITLLAWHMDDITETSMIKDDYPWHMDDTQRRCPLLHHCVRRSLEPCCSIPSLGKRRNIYF